MKSIWKLLPVAIACGFFAGVLTAWLYFASSQEQQGSKLEHGKEFIVKISPDGAYRAFVWLPELGGLGATVSQPMQVWLQGHKAGAERKLVFEADKTDGVHLTWNQTSELEICYDEAQILQFSNRYIVVDRSNGVPEERTVEVVLKRVSKLSDC